MQASRLISPHRRWSEPAGATGRGRGVSRQASSPVTPPAAFQPVLLCSYGPGSSAVASVPRTHGVPYGLAQSLGSGCLSRAVLLASSPHIHARAQAGRRVCRFAVRAARLPSLIHPIAFSRSGTTEHGPRGSPEPSAPPAPTRGSPHHGVHDERR